MLSYGAHGKCSIPVRQRNKSVRKETKITRQLNGAQIKTPLAQPDGFMSRARSPGEILPKKLPNVGRKNTQNVLVENVKKKTSAYRGGLHYYLTFLICG